MAHDADWPEATGVLWSMWLIAVVKLSLASLGFARTLWWVRRVSRDNAENGKVPARVIAAIEREVALAAAFYPGRAACLERSLVLYHRLRRLGAPVELRVGVQPHPFAAHAWVTCHGEPINDSAEHVAHFTVIPDGIA